MRGWCVHSQESVAVLLTHMLGDHGVNHINSLRFHISYTACSSYLLGWLLVSDEITDLKAF